MHEGLIDQASKFKKRVASADTAEYKLVRRNQLVVGFPIDEGVLSFQDLYDEAIVSPAYDTWSLRGDFEVEPAYLERFLRSPRALAFYRVKLRGTTARRRNLPDDIFLRLAVPLPPLPEQRRIADILDQADALRAKRRAAPAQLDTLAQSIFLDMFGDAGENPKAWPVRQVSEYVAEFQGGKSLESESDENAVTRNRVLKVSAVTGMTFLAHECKPVPDSYDPPVDHFVRPGDLLFSRANTTELVGAVAYVDSTPPNLLLPDKLWRFVWRQPAMVEALFIWALFQTPTLRREISRRATGTSGSMKNISQEKVLGISTICPPIPLQKEFANRLAAVEKVRIGYRASNEEIDALFISLQDRAFRGEL
jgi:type I restriction enzyme S subunit